MPPAKFVQLRRTVAETSPTLLLTHAALEAQSVNVFDALVDFVKDPAALPDKGINSLGRLIWRSVGNKLTPTVLDLTGTVPTASFAVVANSFELRGRLVLPRRFSDMVREDLPMQIGAMVNMASHIQDFIAGRVGIDSSETMSTRTRAYEAQAVVALSPDLRGHARLVPLFGYQHALLAEFPEGLKSMPPALVYGQELSI